MRMIRNIGWVLFAIDIILFGVCMVLRMLGDVYFSSELIKLAFILSLFVIVIVF